MSAGKKKLADNWDRSDGGRKKIYSFFFFFHTENMPKLVGPILAFSLAAQMFLSLKEEVWYSQLWVCSKELERKEQNFAMFKPVI